MNYKKNIKESIKGAVASDNFYYEKSAISEMSPRPVPITMSLLKKIYAQNGPVASIYQRYNIKYYSQDFLKIIGNELLIDKNAELKTLFPALAFKGSRPVIKKWDGLFVSLKNIYQFRKISIEELAIITAKLKDKLTNQEVGDNIETVLKQFLADYELIFLINLLSNKTLNNLKGLLGNKRLSQINELLGQCQRRDIFNQLIEAVPSDLIGNSLDVSDKSNFIVGVEKCHTMSKKDKHNHSLSNYRHKKIKQVAQQVSDYMVLREAARWLTVKNVNILRDLLFKLAVDHDFSDKSNIYFASLTEVCRDEFNEVTCLKRKKDYQSNSCSKSAVNNSTGQINNLMGISPGKTSGVLVDINKVDSAVGDLILYSPFLSLDIIKYLDKINGILVDQGGILSHLAIIARERKIPVVTGFNLNKGFLKLGDLIEVDADDEIVTKLSS